MFLKKMTHLKKIFSQYRLKKYGSWLSFGFLFGVWEGFGWLNILPQFILPSPGEIIRAFVNNIDLIAFHTRITLIESLLGLSLSLILAFILAIVMDQFNWVYHVLYPLLITTQTVPTMAIAPILVLWLGYGMTPKIVLIVLTTAFPLVISILDGFRSCDLELLNLFKLLKAKPIQVYQHLKIPLALPYFFAGLRVSVSYAVIAAVVAEWLGGFEGLGVYMIRAKKIFQYDTMFAIIFLISALSLLGMKAVELLEKRILHYKEETKEIQ